jgi:hypothetical protein
MGHPEFLLPHAPNQAELSRAERCDHGAAEQAIRCRAMPAQRQAEEKSLAEAQAAICATLSGLGGTVSASLPATRTRVIPGVRCGTLLAIWRGCDAPISKSSYWRKPEQPTPRWRHSSIAADRLLRLSLVPVECTQRRRRRKLSA